MLLFGRISDWTVLIAVIASAVIYLWSERLAEPPRRKWTLLARGAFAVAMLAVIASVADLGTLLVMHRFDSDYVYEHSARAMDPLYYFPSLWAGQEGSFLLWAFWTSILGMVLACTSGRAERRVMPVYSGVLIFLASMLVIRSPFLSLDLGGMPVPKEGLGLNPNLENPWMVIHPPTLFLGLSSLAVPFAYALMALFWRDWAPRTTPIGGVSEDSFTEVQAINAAPPPFPPRSGKGCLRSDGGLVDIVDHMDIVDGMDTADSFPEGVKVLPFRCAPRQDSWLRRALPWGLFGFATLGLAMMMGGYWAYEMLGWGGFWGWDPVENGPLIPWLLLIGFLHAAQVQRVRGGMIGSTITFALLPFIAGLYETFLTRTGILENFSVHSFSTLGGVGNDVLLYVLLGSLALSAVMLLWRSGELKSEVNVWDAPGTREFGYAVAVLLVTLCALISTIGMSAPLLATLGRTLHLAKYSGSVPEDFYNQANFPIAVLLVIGMGLTPYLSWKQAGVDERKLLRFYGAAVIGAAVFTLLRYLLGSPIGGGRLVAQLVLFTGSIFALAANGHLLVTRIMHRRASEPTPARSSPPLPIRKGEESMAERTGTQPTISAAAARAATAGGVLSHIGVAVLFLGIVCLVTFVRKDEHVLLVQGESRPVLGGAYTMTYLGQTGDYETDRNNALKFNVVSRDGHERFTALLPFALRPVEGGDKKIFAHPAIAHHATGDLYLALDDGPVDRYPSDVFHKDISLNAVAAFGPYTLHFQRFVRDPAAAAMIASGNMPAVFPVTAVVDVTYHGRTSTVQPQLITRMDNPAMPDSPEMKLPGGWLISFESMNAGSTSQGAPSADMAGESAKFMLRADDGPPAEGFWLDITTRPMINLVWMGTLLLVVGGLLSMRRRILENRAWVELDPEPTADIHPRRGYVVPPSPAKPRRRAAAGVSSFAVAEAGTHAPSRKRGDKKGLLPGGPGDQRSPSPVPSPKREGVP